MLADKRCLDCGSYHFEIGDAVGKELRKGGKDRYPERGEHFFDVFCPSCGREQGLVINRDHPFVFTIWPCSWNDEPCCENDCGYCEGEYVG